MMDDAERPCISCLPTEIIELICQHSSTVELKNLRLANRHIFASLATRELLRHLNCYPNTASHDWLNRVATFPAHAGVVKTLTYSNAQMLEGDPIWYDDFDAWYSEVRNISLRPRSVCFAPNADDLCSSKSRGRLMHQRYRGFMDADVALDSYATEIKSLEASLMHFRNLKHVVYDDEPEKKYDKVTQQTCVYRHPRYSLAFERFFRLLVALEQSALGAMNSLRCGALFLFGFNFTIEHLRGGTLQDVRPFKGLVELAAGFRSYNVLPSKPERFKKAFYYLAALTHGIERLSLVLDIGNEPCPELQNEPWLSTTIWPALKFLHLHEGSLDEVVLHELLQSRATTLRHLTLEDMDLRDVESLSLYSGWVYTFGFIRRTLALDTFNILGKLSEARMRVWYAQPARERLEEKPHGIWTARSIELYVSRKADIDLFRPVLSEGKLLGWAVEEDSSWCDVSNADVPLIYGGSSIPRCEASSGHLYC